MNKTEARCVSGSFLCVSGVTALIAAKILSPFCATVSGISGLVGLFTCYGACCGDENKNKSRFSAVDESSDESSREHEMQRSLMVTVAPVAQQTPASPPYQEIEIQPADVVREQQLTLT